MFRSKLWRSVNPACFPHVRGDVPNLWRNVWGQLMFSPRAWGCSVARGRSFHASPVFPTCVGMFRHESGRIKTRLGFPHVRGDVPALQK